MASGSKKELLTPDEEKQAEKLLAQMAKDEAAQKRADAKAAKRQ